MRYYLYSFSISWYWNNEANEKTKSKTAPARLPKQKANPNATDSELDAKKIVYPEYRGLPDFNEKLSPTEDKIIQALCEEVV